MTSRVTVVMAAYNAAATIESAVASVRGQTLGDFELLVVDDGSTDDTVAVLAGIDEPRLRVIRQANAGPAAARNRALAEARAEYVACIDADDLWVPEKLAWQSAALAAAPTAAVAYGWADVVDADLAYAYSDRRISRDGDVYAALLLSNFIFSGSNTMIRGSVLDRLGGFDAAMRAVEDWELHVRIARDHPFVCVPRVLLRYRLTEGSLSGRIDLMDAAFSHACRKIFAAAPPEHAHLEARCRAAFSLYLATRAAQVARGPRDRITALQFALRALRLAPASWLGVLRVAAPLGSLRLAAREHRRRASAVQGASSAR
jgi:glycosyltransferase involved in cell wall biosynthesis